ncbi:MAG: 2Fe-2S iron-sulfur cluster-binding protein [Motiliproteus sp.]
MGHKFSEIAFTPTVRDIQTVAGSRDGYAGMDQGEDYNHLLSEREATFISARDSFYMASVSQTGWPYVQHRGGPVGFLKVLDASTLGFADYSGNRQYVSTGNFSNDDRVALFLMDYPNRTRLKILGRVQMVGLDDDETLARLEDDSYRARIERGLIIKLEAFDWNCPQHITPRFSECEIEAEVKTTVERSVAPLVAENDRLRVELAASNTKIIPTPHLIADHADADVGLTLVISGMRQLTPRVRAYELRDPEGHDLPPVGAGSHLQLPITLGSGQQVTRYYSIASNPARRDAYEIAVLRDETGSGGSLAVHNNFRLGTVVRTALPDNLFAVHTDQRPAVLIAGGIGITPIKAMAQALIARGTAMQLHYAGRSLKEMPYRDRLQRQLAERMRVYAKDEGERLDIAATLAAAPDNSVFYVCGPARLIDGVIAATAAAGIAPERVHFERFEAGLVAGAKSIQVKLARSGTVVQVEPNQTVLDAMLEVGVDIPHSCRSGNCKSCAVRVLEGDPDHRDAALSDEERNQHQLMCPCVSRATTDSLVLDI